MAEIGDVHRFASADRLCSWAGLTPRHYESDTVVRRGYVTKQDSKLVRWAVVEAVQRKTTPKTTEDRPGSRPVAAGTSPRSPRHASCSHWSTTGCATDRSAPWPARQREHLGRGRRAVGQLSDPLHGVVAVLIDPACRTSHRSMRPRAAKE